MWKPFIATMVAAAGLAYAATPSPGFAQEKPDVPRLINELTHPNGKVADAAYASLKKIGLPAFDELLKAFTSADGKTRGLVASLLGELRHEAFKNKNTELADRIEAVLLEALRDPHHDVVNGAAAALGAKEPRSKKAIPEFIALLRKEQRKEDKHDLAWVGPLVGLQNNGPDGAAAIPTLIEVLSDRKESDRRRWGACSVLAVIGPKDERVPPALTKVATNANESINMRHSAVESLVTMGSGQSAVAVIVELIDKSSARKKDPLVSRAGLVSLLGKVKLTEKEIRLLISIAIDREEDLFSREAAVESLASAGRAAKSAWIPLLQILQNERWDHRFGMKVVSALGTIEPRQDDRKELVRELRSALQDIVRDEGNFKGIREEFEKILKKLENR